MTVERLTPCSPTLVHGSRAPRGARCDPVPTGFAARGRRGRARGRKRWKETLRAGQTAHSDFKMYIKTKWRFLIYSEITCMCKVCPAHSNCPQSPLTLRSKVDRIRPHPDRTPTAPGLTRNANPALPAHARPFPAPPDRPGAAQRHTYLPGSRPCLSHTYLAALHTP